MFSVLEQSTHYLFIYSEQFRRDRVMCRPRGNTNLPPAIWVNTSSWAGSTACIFCLGRHCVVFKYNNAK